MDKVIIEYVKTGRRRLVSKRDAKILTGLKAARYVGAELPAEVPSTPEVKVAEKPVLLAPAIPLQAMTIEQLREHAKAKGLEFHPQLGKERLIKLINGA